MFRRRLNREIGKTEVHIETVSACKENIDLKLVKVEAVGKSDSDTAADIVHITDNEFVVKLKCRNKV